MRLKNKSPIFLIILTLLIVAIGFLLGKSALNPKSILPPSSITFPVKTLSNISLNTYPLWLDNHELIYVDKSAAVVYELTSEQTRTLFSTPSDPIDLLLVNVNAQLISTGSPFAEIKKYFIFKNGALSEVNLSKYGKIQTLSLFPDGNSFSFVGLSNPYSNTGHLYIYNLNNNQVTGPIFRELGGEVLSWISDQEGLLYSFTDAGGIENLTLVSVSSKSLTPLNLPVSGTSTISFSPDKTRFLISGENSVSVVTLPESVIIPLNVTGSFFANWINDSNLLLVSKGRSPELSLYNISSKELKLVSSLKQLQEKSIFSASLSPDTNQLLVRTDDKFWYLISLNSLPLDKN